MKCFGCRRNAALAFCGLAAFLFAPAPAQADTTVPVSSAALVFSPGNWVGDSGRGGSVYRQTWNAGAYLRVSWVTTAAHPTAALLLDTSPYGANPSLSPTLTYVVDGAWTDGVACTGTVPIQGLGGPGPHTLTVYVKSSPQSSRWGSPGVSGTNVVRVTGLRLDDEARPDTAARPLKWALEIGDSITEGIQANNGADDNLADYSFLVGQALQTQGYEYGVSACGYSGWLRPGDGGGDVPGYYVVAGGAYDDSKSRWNKIDGNGHSLLDSRGHLSAYGGLGQEPAIVTLNYGTNDALNGVNAEDTQSSIGQSLAALRRAAPGAAIFVIVPFGQYDADVIHAALQQYRRAHPADRKVFGIDLGAAAARTLAAGNYWGGLHPNLRGHAAFAARITAAIEAQIRPENAQNAAEEANGKTRRGRASGH